VKPNRHVSREARLRRQQHEFSECGALTTGPPERFLAGTPVRACQAVVQSVQPAGAGTGVSVRGPCRHGRLTVVVDVGLYRLPFGHDRQGGGAWAEKAPDPYTILPPTMVSVDSMQRHPGVVARDACGVRARPNRDPRPEHPRKGRRVAGGVGPVAVDEILPLVRHAVLNGDAAAQRLDPLEVSLRDGLGVIEEPPLARERHLPLDRLEHVEETADRLVVRHMQSKWPTMMRQQLHDPCQFLLQRCQEVWAGSSSSCPEG
jgi:hypothetical protein